MTKTERTQYLNRKHRDEWNTMVRRARTVPCVDCGLFEPEIMDLDHVPERGDKAFPVGHKNGSSLGRLRAELEKCDTVCPNCHKRRTNRRLADAGRV